MRNLAHNLSPKKSSVQNTGLFSMGNYANVSAIADRGLAWVRKESRN